MNSGRAMAGGTPGPQTSQSITCRARLRAAERPALFLLGHPIAVTPIGMARYFRLPSRDSLAIVGVIIALAASVNSGCGNAHPLLDNPNGDGAAQCDDRLENLKSLLQQLAPDQRSVAGIHRTLGFDLPVANLESPLQGAAPGPVLVVKPGAVGWLASHESSWVRGDLANLTHDLASAPHTRPHLWWRLDSDDGHATELTQDQKGFRNTATGVPEGIEPLVAVHPGAPWELVTAALRGLSLYGYTSVQLLFAAPIVDGEELATNATTPALWHPETGLTTLEFTDLSPELVALKGCPGAFYAIKSMRLMGWSGRVETLTQVLPEALENCRCNVDFDVLQPAILGWLNAGDNRAATVAVRLDIRDAPLEAIERRLEPYSGQPWIQVSADASRR